MPDNNPVASGRGAAYSDFAQRNQQYQAKVDAHRNQPKQDDSYIKYVPDLASNFAQQAYQEARTQQQGDLPYESRSMTLPFRSTYQPSIMNRIGQAASGALDVATGLAGGVVFGHGPTGGINKLQQANMHNLGPEYTSQAQYLPEQFSKQNTEIAVARILGTNPALIKKPDLLFAAATKDMKAHDIQRLATYSDFTDAYNAMLSSPDGFVNAAKSMSDRINNAAGQVPAQAVGKVFDTAIHVVSSALKPLGQSLGISDGGRMSVNINGQDMALGPNVTKEITSSVGKAFNAAFDVQHTIRALHDIRATQGDAAYYSAVATVVGTTVLTTFAMDGLGRLLMRSGGRALTDALIANGIDTEGLNITELRALAEKANISPEGHRAWLQAAAKFLHNIPASKQAQAIKALGELGMENAVPGAAATDTVGGITAYSREGGLGLTQVEKDALTGAPLAEGEVGELPSDVFNRLGNVIGKATPTVGKVLSNSAGLPFKYPKVPMNFQLGSQVIFNTNGFGMGDHWKDSWDRTADGRTYVDPRTKRAVSLGREVADAFGGKPNDWWYNAVSGPLDLWTMFAFDPTMAAFKLMPVGQHLPALRSRTDVYNMMATDPRAQEMADAIVRVNLRAKSTLESKIEEERKLLSSKMSARRAKLRAIGATSEQIAAATSSPKWRPTDAQLKAIVQETHQGADSYADILRLFPQLGKTPEGIDPSVDFVAKLTTAESRSDVADILGDMAAANAMMDPHRLPSYGQFTRMKDYLYEKNRQAIAEGDLSKMGKLQKTLARGAVSIKPTYFQDLRQFSNQIARVGSPSSLDLIRRTFLAAGRSPGEVDLLVNRLARTTNDFEWRVIYKNFVQDQFHIEAKSFLDNLVEEKGFSAYEAATLRNALERPFRSVIEQLSNTAGGGASNAAYTGTRHNYVASRIAPMDGEMLPTAGLLGAHEHYFALPDYRAWDKFKNDIVKGLKDTKPDGLRAQMYNAGKEVVAKPFDDKISGLVSHINELSKNISANKAAMREAFGDAEKEKLVQKNNQIQAQIDAYKQQVTAQTALRDAAIQERLGPANQFQVLQEGGAGAKAALYNFHDVVRNWFIDKYFRQAVLATGSFSMRVAAAETIANIFRLGGREYSKAWLATHVSEGIAKAAGVGAKEITPIEHGMVMSMVHDVLSALKLPEAKAATGKAVKGSVNSFLQGLASGLGMDDFVQLLAKDIIERGGTLWGIGAEHGAMESYGTMHNLASGHGTGNWEFRNTVDNESLAGLTKSLNDTAHFEPARQTANILNEHLDPASEIVSGDVYQRLEAAREANRDAIRSMVARDPKKYESMLRSGQYINNATHERLVEEVKQELGVTSMDSQKAQNLLLVKQSKINPIDEWADALFEHVLWLSHGRGRTNELFNAENLNDKILHRHVLKMLAEGKAPYTPELTRDLYVNPDLEQARVLTRRDAHTRQGLERPSYHSVLYSDNSNLRDVKSLTDKELAHLKIPARRANVGESLAEGLTPLERMALQYKDFESFSKDFSSKGHRPVVWHFTYEKDFNPKEDFLPSVGGDKPMSPNLFTTTEPEQWEDWISKRPYAIQYDISNLKPGVDFDYDKRGLEGIVIKPNGYKKLKKMRSMSHDEAIKAIEASNKQLPQSKDALRKVWDKAHESINGVPSAAFEGMTNQEIRDAVIKANTPMRTGFKNKFAGKSKNSVSRLYEDINGETTSRFPANIPTQIPIPSGAPGALEAASSVINKGASWVHDTISAPVINTLAREPLYAVELAQQMNTLKPLVKDGTLPLDVAMTVARTRAIEHAIKFVHNPQDRFVFEQWARAFAPFWFAKNQAMRRAGRLAITNPLGFERYLRAMLVMQNYGAASANNSQNQSAMLMPGSMLGGRLMTDFLKTIGMAPAGGVPIGLRGSTSSLASVFPWTDPSGENPGNAVSLAESVRPDFGPLVSLPIRAFAMGNPYNHSLQTINDKALGSIGSQSSLFQQLVPNSLVRSLISMGSSLAFNGRNQTTAAIDALQAGLMSQALEDRHKQLAKGAKKQAVIDWNNEHDSLYTAQHQQEYKSYIDAMTTAYVNEGIWYGDKQVQKPIGYYYQDPNERTYLVNSTHRAALALYAGRTALSFFSPLSLSITEVNPEMKQLVRDAQATNGDFKKAEQLYIKHPEAIYYVAHGTATQTGVPLPATLDMSKFQNENADLFRKGGNASGLIAFVPYSDKGNVFDSNEYHNQLSAGLRRSLTPPEFLDKMAAAVGNNYVYNYLPQLNAKFEGGNSEALRKAKAIYARANPLWAKTLGDTKKSRINALDQVRNLLDTPGIDRRTGFKDTAPKIRTIVAKYDEFYQRYKNADSGWHNYLETEWENWLTDYANKHKEITIGANAIFKGLKLSDNK